MPKTVKKKASDTMSRFVRLRGAIEYCREHAIDMTQFNRPEDLIGQCCTCSTVKSWIYMDGGHCLPRGIGGGSGAYFLEQNCHLQCKRCNKWGGGKEKEHREYIIEKYGQAVMDDLEKRHMIPIDMRELAMIAMEAMYKELYNELIQQNGL